MNDETKTWKVEYFKDDTDWSNKIKTTSEFDNFEEARKFTIMRIDCHTGSVKLIHPDVCPDCGSELINLSIGIGNNWYGCKCKHEIKLNSILN